MDKDVHTEHCCSRHGCKYGNDNCTVVTGKVPQSFPCEQCQDIDEELMDWPLEVDEDGGVFCIHVDPPVRKGGTYNHCDICIKGWSSPRQLLAVLAAHVKEKHS